MKTAMQLKARSRNLSAKTGTPPHIIQRNFFFERFLERTALSPCRDSAACVAFGTANTRMKDYYDIHVLTQLKSGDINRVLFASALSKTALQRHIDLSDSRRVIDEIAIADDMRSRWRRYQKDYSYAAEISFVDTINALRTLVDWSESDADCC